MSDYSRRQSELKGPVKTKRGKQIIKVDEQ